jgi:hypothetical protein
MNFWKKECRIALVVCCILLITVQSAFGVTVTTRVRGDGAVTLDPPGGSYPAGSQITITAHPAGEMQFDHWEIITAPTTAGSPSPADNAFSPDRDVELSWSPGTDSPATSHDVYFGTSNPPVFIGNQSATTYDPGTLAKDKKYYWRIDEKNSAGITIGSVWSFTVAPDGCANMVVAGNGVAASWWSALLLLMATVMVWRSWGGLKRRESKVRVMTFLLLALGLLGVTKILWAWTGVNNPEIITVERDMVITAFFNREGEGQWTQWSKYGVNPVYRQNGPVLKFVSDPTIIKDAGIYRMFYTNGKRTGIIDPDPVLCEATSTDGLTWLPLANGETNPPGMVLQGPPGTWYEQLESPAIYKIDAGYYLFFGGYAQGGTPEGYPAHLGLATSTNGTTFSFYRNTPIMEADTDFYDGDAVYSADIIEHDGTYYMVYCAHCHTHCTHSSKPIISIMGATSKDLINWTKTEQPILTYDLKRDWMNGYVAEPAYLKGPNGKFYLFFTAFSYDEDTSIGLAESSNPFGPWEVCPYPILEKGLGEWDGDWIGAPDVLIEDNVVKMWYTGWQTDFSTSGVGYATAPWPLRANPSIPAPQLKVSRQTLGK